jgi:hypothetical protein
MAYNNTHFIFHNEDNASITTSLTDGNDIWLSVTHNSISANIRVTIQQANQIIDALSSVIGEYEEAKALAEFDAQRDLEEVEA